MIEFIKDEKLSLYHIVKNGESIGYISKFNGDNDFHSRTEINLWPNDHEQILAKMKELRSAQK